MGERVERRVRGWLGREIGGVMSGELTQRRRQGWLAWRNDLMACGCGCGVCVCVAVQAALRAALNEASRVWPCGPQAQYREGRQAGQGVGRQREQPQVRRAADGSITTPARHTRGHPAAIERHHGSRDSTPFAWPGCGERAYGAWRLTVICVRVRRVQAALYAALDDAFRL